MKRIAKRLEGLIALSSVVFALLADTGAAQSIATAKLLPDGAFVNLQNKTSTVGKDDFRKILPQFEPGVRSGTVQCGNVTEASGIAASRKNANVLWVHNDSGDTARVFAMNASGQHLGTYNLTGVTAVDCEDMAIGPGPISGESYIYLGDIGDNNAVRSSVAVYRVAEPAVSSSQAPVNVNLSGVQTFWLRYEDGPRDAETLMIDPTNGDLYVVSKRESRSRVYRAAASALNAGGTTTLSLVGRLPWGWATGGDIAPNGSEIIIRGYTRAALWRRPPGANLWDAFSGTEYAVPLVTEPQGEAIGFDGSGRGYYTVSEGVNQPIYYFSRVPDQTHGFLYIQESQRSCGIRVAAAPASVNNLMRGSVVSVAGWLGTTPDGERQLVSPTITVAADPPAEPEPLAMSAPNLGGGDFGSPPLGQCGAAGGYGVNNVGLLVRTWGRVTHRDAGGAYVVVSDGRAPTVRADISLIETDVNAGDYVSVAGISSLVKSGAETIRLILPRAASDVTKLTP